VTSPTVAPGTLLATHWIVGGLLGRSDFAEVFEAEETSGNVAALKLFSAALRSQPKPWDWFEGLCRALSRMPQQSIARIHEVGVEPRLELGFVASERMAQPNLGRLVSERGPLSPRVWGMALGGIGEALDAAHAERMLHGNLKPQNVFVAGDEPGFARITDFGGAQLRAANGIHPALTLGWYAPEIDAGQASPAIDRYALGIVSFFALTGFPWFAALRGHTADGSQHMSALMPSVGSASERARNSGGALHPAFDAWFAKALALDPAARFGTSTEMARAFDKAAVEAERVTSAAVAAARPPDSQPLSATMPLARPVDPALLNLPFPPAQGQFGSVAPAARASVAPYQPSRAPGPVNRRSLALFATLGAAFVLLSLGLLWAFTRSSDEPEADAATAASASAVPVASAPAAPPKPEVTAEAPATVAKAPEPAPPPAAAPQAAPPVAPSTKAVAPSTKPVATATKPKAAATQPKAAVSTKASVSTSTKSTATRTKKKCGTFLKCK
jgi:serine/threonine protein kinase